MKNNQEQTNNHNSVIKVFELRKKFGNFTAVDGISFDVYKGEIFTLRKRVAER